jgi:hypothetical protein
MSKSGGAGFERLILTKDDSRKQGATQKPYSDKIVTIGVVVAPLGYDAKTGVD